MTAKTVVFIMLYPELAGWSRCHPTWPIRDVRKYMLTCWHSHVKIATCCLVHDLMLFLGNQHSLLFQAFGQFLLKSFRKRTRRRKYPASAAQREPAQSPESLPPRQVPRARAFRAPWRHGQSLRYNMSGEVVSLMCSYYIFVAWIIFQQ